MSLTQFLQDPEVKDRFRSEFKKPAVTRKMLLQAPPQTNNYSLVGSAFDYLLRFYLEYHNQTTRKSNIWLADTALTLLESWIRRGQITKEQFISVQKIVENAKARHKTFLQNGDLTDELIGSAIQLARLEMVYRIGILSEYIESIRSEDVQDLKKMISLIPPEKFHANNICILNPTFGFASKVVGGADADLIIDDTLIEIKTTINPKFERDYFNQLIGYMVLKRICEMKILTEAPDAETKKSDLPKEEVYDFSSLPIHKITKVGVYFSRYGVLQTIDVGSMTNNGKFSGEFIDWFLNTCGVPDAEE
ncbi:hypothetical protein [Methanoregula sp.]|uniref:hypothetical protein n=1 Tax=Methanoregula sp. TaxID=2052170 RepID=UPI00356259ED